MRNAAFYSYINTGILPQAERSNEAYAMVNTGILPQAERSNKAYAMVNTGVIPQIAPHGITYSYLNLGLPIPEQRTVTRGPRGWGILPVDKKEFIVFTNESKGKTYAYLYMKQP